MHTHLLSLVERAPQRLFFRRLAASLSKPCENCGALRLSQAFDIILNPAKASCWKCRANAKLIKLALVIPLSVSGLKASDLSSLLSIPLYRRILLSIVSGLATFGFRTPQPTGAPLAVVWNFTDQCNLNCVHCYQDAGGEISSRELSTNEALRAVEEMAHSGVAALSFSGGEPLVRNDFYAVAQRASDLGLSLSISTNGTLIDQEAVDRLLDAGIETVAISIDSLEPDFHDQFRGVPGSWEQAWDGVQACVIGGEDGRQFREIIVNTTLTAHSFRDIPKIHQMAREAGVTRYYVSRILPVGRGKSASSFDIPPTARKAVLEYLAQQSLKTIKKQQNPLCLARGMTYYARECFEQSQGLFFPVSEIVTGLEAFHQDHFSNRLARLVRLLGRKAGGCATGITYCGLSPEGDLLPCAPLSDCRLGSLRDHSFLDIWQNHPVFRYLRERNHLKGKCGLCDHRQICGGCRATAYGHTGDFLESDPSCPYPD
ncbi:MAG: radical SAM protein [Candidatus Hodarchaeota archaeon]